jgi:transcriptional regulator with XRE-family HTH domain
MTTDLGPAPAAAVSFGALLRRLRLAREATMVREYHGTPRIETHTLSQNELARRAGVDVAAVHRHEAGTLHPIRRTVEKLSEALELGPEERAALLVAAGFWPWTDADGGTTELLVALGLAVLDGDYRPLEQTVRSKR